MIKIPTDELMDALNKSSSVHKYLEGKADNLIDIPVAQYLQQLIAEKGLKKAKVIKDAELNEIYGYQIFSGKRFPSRDKLLSISFGMCLSVDEVQQLLKYAGYAMLYPKSKRDSIILWGLSHGDSICRTNELLYEEQEETL